MPKLTSNQKTAGGSKPAAESGDRQPKHPCKDVNELEEPQKEAVRTLLTEGATFEDTKEAVNGMGKKQVDLQAIKNYFRSNVVLQQARIRHMLRVASELKKALTDPKSGKTELAEAVLITGLMGATRAEARAQVQRAFRMKDQEENQRLKEQAFRLKTKKLNLDLRFLTLRLETEMAKRDLLARQVKALQETAERAGGDHTLTPEIIQQIQEIYGLISVREFEGEGETSTHV